MIERERKNIRLRNYDYTSEGWYFITICTYERRCFFGKIDHGEMNLTPIGQQAEIFWTEMPMHFPQVQLGEFVVMPNHIHGIIGIIGDGSTLGTRHVGTRHGVSLQNPPMNQNQFGKTIPGSISAMVGQFKSSLSRWCNKNNYEIFAWQPRFHDHIIRNQPEFDRIEHYIIHNPVKWNEDKFYDL